MRSERFKIIKVLRALNYFYSLRDLEKALNVSFQNLWRYINALAIPSDSIASQIMSRLEQLKLVDRVLRDVVVKYRSAPALLASNMGFLVLCSVTMEEKLRDLDIEYVLAASEEAVPLATVLSLEMGAELCAIPLHSEVPRDEVKIFWYYSTQKRGYELMLIPKACLHAGKRVYVVDIVLSDLDKLASLISFIEHHDVAVEGAFAVYVDRAVASKLKELGLKRLDYIDTL